MHNTFYALRKNGFVYILRDQYGVLKIGATHDADKRYKMHKAKNPSLVSVAYIPAVRYMYLERFIHWELEEYMIKREWFYCKNENVIIEKIVNFINAHGSIFGAGNFTFH